MTDLDDLEAVAEAIDRDFEPARWMLSMERVVDAYKREVELLRTQVAAQESNLDALRVTVEYLQDTVSDLQRGQ